MNRPFKLENDSSYNSFHLFYVFRRCVRASATPSLKLRSVHSVTRSFSFVLHHIHSFASACCRDGGRLASNGPTTPEPHVAK